MTRFLSEVLGAAEPAFSQSIRQLERAAGTPSADIRLTSEIMGQMRQKIASLNLDPSDTNGPELYSALRERLKSDESKIRTALAIADDASGSDVISKVQRFVEKYDLPKRCFALKSSVAKKLLKKKIPKNAMKQLGYRSADSMLKHESVASIYAAAIMVETESWHRNFREQYVKLAPTDFEMRKISVVSPSSKHWEKMASKFVNAARHNILSFPELGAIVLLPIDQAVDGLAITTLLLTLEELNGILAHSSYTKLQQVKPDFGRIIQKSSVAEPFTSATLAGQPVPWRMIQRYYAKYTEAYHPEIFEPHVQPEDMQWCISENVLASIEPSLDFWKDTQCLGLLYNGDIVSCNVLDVALSYCNHLPFKDRVVHFLRNNLWHELMMRYLNQDNLEAAVHKQLLAELAPSQLALAEQESYNGVDI
ncbi:MAG TPA: hypothetical protein VMR45_00730 [Patescibacteria group bacterium]|nr:hypothetical protein [Patescibacteria group bacterium]